MKKDNLPQNADDLANYLIEKDPKIVFCAMKTDDNEAHIFGVGLEQDFLIAVFESIAKILEDKFPVHDH
jgi:hypothetical protein